MDGAQLTTSNRIIELLEQTSKSKKIDKYYKYGINVNLQKCVTIKDRFSFHCLYCQCTECCRRVEGGGCIVWGRCWCQDITLQLCNFVHNPTWHSADSATFYNYKQTWSSRTIPASSYLWFNKTDGFWTRRWREVHPLYSHYTHYVELETKVIRRFQKIWQPRRNYAKQALIPL